MKAKKIIKILKPNGWEHSRTRGSHFMMKKKGVLVTVPLHGNKDIRVGTLKQIQKLSGVNLK